MGIATLVLLFVTVLAGVGVLAEFADPKRLAAMRGATAMVALHLTLALAAGVVWIVFLLHETTGAAWAGFGVLVATAAAGVTLYLRSERIASGDGSGARPVSRAVLVVHGAVAAATLVAGLLAAAGLGR